MPLQIAMLRPWMVMLFKRVSHLTLITLFTFAWISVASPISTERAFAQEAPASTPDRVVATVNADPISSQDLADETMRRYGTQVTESMVNRYLILQACKASGIEVSKKDINQEIERQASKFRLDLPSYLQLLREERNITEDEYASTIVWPMLALRRLVADRVQVTEQEYNKAYQARFGEAVKCRMILLSNHKQAQEIHAAVKSNPAQFEELAKKYSEDETSASIGGLIMPIRRNSGDPQFEQVVFSLADGQISDLVPMGNQWLILQSVRRMPKVNVPLTSAPAIRAQIEDQIRDEKVRAAASELFTQLQNQAKVQLVYGDQALMNQHPGVAALINGEALSIRQVAAEAVKRHGQEVLDGEINRKMLVQALRQVKKTVESEDLTRETARAAVDYGFINADGTPNIQSWLESVTSDGETTQDIYVRDAVWPSVALQKLVEDNLSVDADEMKRGFESAYGPKAEVLAIVMGDQRTAQKIWQMARDNPTETFFSELARTYSIEPSSAANDGKVPPLRKFGGQPTIEKEAFALSPGELSGIIATGDKYIILRCLGFTEPIVTSMDDVRSELLRDLSERKLNRMMAEKFDELKQNAEIENYFVAATRGASQKR